MSPLVFLQYLHDTLLDYFQMYLFIMCVAFTPSSILSSLWTNDLEVIPGFFLFLFRFTVKNVGNLHRECSRVFSSERTTNVIWKQTWSLYLESLTFMLSLLWNLLEVFTIVYSLSSKTNISLWPMFGNSVVMGVSVVYS